MKRCGLAWASCLTTSLRSLSGRDKSWQCMYRNSIRRDLISSMYVPFHVFLSTKGICRRRSCAYESSRKETWDLWVYLVELVLGLLNMCCPPRWSGLIVCPAWGQLLAITSVFAFQLCIIWYMHLVIWNNPISCSWSLNRHFLSCIFGIGADVLFDRWSPTGHIDLRHLPTPLWCVSSTLYIRCSPTYRFSFFSQTCLGPPISCWL